MRAFGEIQRSSHAVESAEECTHLGGEETRPVVMVLANVEECIFADGIKLL